MIAALTVPTLVANSQEAGFRSAFLKNYSIISNAYTQSIRDGVPFWDPSYSNTDNWMISPIYQDDPNLIKDYFKVHGEPRIATKGAGPYAIGYFYRGKKSSETFNNIGKYLNGSKASGMFHNASAYAFQLEDGTVIGFYITNGLAWMVFIDVNGAKAPNTVGKDIYFLQGTYWALDSTGHYKLLPYGAPGTGDAWRNKKDDCYKNSTGMTCGYQILKNKGYIIPDKKS